MNITDEMRKIIALAKKLNEPTKPAPPKARPQKPRPQKPLPQK